MDMSRFVGLPWRDRGRGPDGFDCWGLLRHVYASCLGIDLPSHDGAYLSAADREALSGLIDTGLEDWREISPANAATFDGVLMTEAGVKRHIGIVAGPRLVLHIEPGANAVIQRADSLALRRRIAGYYRFDRR